MLVTIDVDGQKVEAAEGALLGHVLHWVKGPRLRQSPRAGAPRGLYCGMGVCFECLVRVDGRDGVRSCLQPVRDGMTVETGT